MSQSMDYRFLGESESEEQVTYVLDIRERRLKMTWRCWFQEQERNFFGLQRDQRGSSTSFWAQHKVSFRYDNEPAIEALAREIAQARQGSQTVPERPPVGEGQSN